MLRFGPTVGYLEFAEILSTTPAALRLRDFRRKDLPLSICGLASRRWATPTVADWLLMQSEPKPTSTETSRRGPGRPRKQRNGAQS